MLVAVLDFDALEHLFQSVSQPTKTQTVRLSRPILLMLWLFQEGRKWLLV